MTNEWDAYASDWDVDPSVTDYANKAFESLSKIIKLDGLSVMDFGCGTGSLSQLLSPRVNNIVALDGSSQMISVFESKKLENVSTLCGFLSEELIQNERLLQNQFDLIVASSVCSFLPDYPGTLALLKSLLKEGGMFVQWDWLTPDDDADMGLSENTVRQVLSEQGFSQIIIQQPFVMNSSKGSMSVLMASAMNS